ncbi:MAG: response regulator [Halobacteriovoraceae bacterium]|nr:response regulator [Halobacteriovoraceae bacterium]
MNRKNNKQGPAKANNYGPLEEFFPQGKLSTSDILTFFGKEKEEKKVLIVEDDVSQIEFIEELISQVNPDASVDCYFSAEDALEKIENTRALKNEKDYDVIIADVFLKGMANGLDLYAYCKKYYPESEFIVISSFGEETLREVFSGEFDEISYIQKPISLSTFDSEIGKRIKNKKGQ